MNTKEKLSIVHHRIFPFQFKAVNEETDGPEGKVKGYASTFGNIDQGKDRVIKGAFKESLKKNGGKIPILADHNSSNPIGVNYAAKEDDHGLLVEGELDIENNQLAKERFHFSKLQIKHGMKSGLSIGYRILKYSVNRKDGPEKGVWNLEKLDLIEYSLVAFPMNQEATVTSAKCHKDDDIAQLMKKIADFRQNLQAKVLTDSIKLASIN